MSKRRNSSSLTPRNLKFIRSNLQNAETTMQSSNFLKSMELDTTKRRSLKTEMTNDQHLSTVFNRNISKFRDLINSNDQSLLPFISSLRDCSEKRKTKLYFPTKTKIQPFRVADKITCNQKIQKEPSDIKGRTKRVSNTFYRWHNKSGSGVKESCFFQTTLRETSSKFYTKNTFKNMFGEIKKPRLQRRVYTQSEIICPKQRRLFDLQV